MRKRRKLLTVFYDLFTGRSGGVVLLLDGRPCRKREKWNTESRLTTCYMHAPRDSLHRIFESKIFLKESLCLCFFLCFISYSPQVRMTCANFLLVSTPTSSFFFSSQRPKGFGMWYHLKWRYLQRIWPQNQLTLLLLLRAAANIQHAYRERAAAARFE